MSDYTPTTDEIRNVWGEFSEYGGLTNRTSGGSLIDARYAEFDRWLATHDRDIQAQALREAADVLDRPRVIWYGDGGVTVLEAGTGATLDDYRAERPTVVEWLRARAGRLADTTEETT